MSNVVKCDIVKAFMEYPIRYWWWTPVAEIRYSKPRDIILLFLILFSMISFRFGRFPNSAPPALSRYRGNVYIYSPNTNIIVRQPTGVRLCCQHIGIGVNKSKPIVYLPDIATASGTDIVSNNLKTVLQILI